MSAGGRYEATLYLRPLREGPGEGPAPVWTVSCHAAELCEEIRSGAAWDELTWAAREGSWLARIESPTIVGPPYVQAAYVAQRGRITELPRIGPMGRTVFYVSDGVEPDVVSAWESPKDVEVLFAMLDPYPITDYSGLTRLCVKPEPLLQGQLGPLAWRCIWRASIAIARRTTGLMPPKFVRRTEPLVAILDAWSRMPDARGDDDRAEAAAKKLAEMTLYEMKKPQAKSSECAVLARGFAGVGCARRAIEASQLKPPLSEKSSRARDEFAVKARQFLATVVRHVVGDDLYLSLLDQGKVRHE